MMYELHLQIMPDQWIHHPSLPLYRRLPLPSGEARSKKPAAAAAAAKPPCQPSARRALSWCALARPMHNQADCAHSPDSPDLPPPPSLQLAFPPATTPRQRAILHAAAEAAGLHHASTGEGEARQIVVGYKDGRQVGSSSREDV